MTAQHHLRLLAAYDALKAAGLSDRISIDNSSRGTLECPLRRFEWRQFRSKK